MAPKEGPRAEANGARELFLQPVASYNPFEETFAQLARAIRLGAVAVGDRFPPERELGERLGVSRTTVREAIRGLEQAGYITTRRGRYGGTFVVRDTIKPPPRDRERALGPALAEALDFRIALEPGAAALAARKAERAKVDQMRAIATEIEGASTPEFVRGNCRLHIAVAQLADCAPILRAVTTLEVQVMDALLAVPKLDSSMSHSHLQHHAIIEAIAAGDPRVARDAMEEHLAASDVLMRELASPKRRRG